MLPALANCRQTAVTLASAIAFAFALPFIFFAIDYLGVNIHNSLRIDAVGDYIKAAVAAIIIFIGLALAPLNENDKKNLLWIWFAKVLVTLGAMLFYERNYGLDAYWYFEISQSARPDLTGVGIGNGTANMLAIVWGFENYIFNTASYHTQKVLCAFLGMLGIYFFYRGVKNTYPKLPNRFLLILGLFPSILFWSSILGKDPIMTLGIGLSFYSMLQLNNTRNLLYLLPMILGFLLVALMRSWMVPILFFPFVVGGIFRYKNILVRLTILTTLVTAAFYEFRYVADSYEFNNAEDAARGVGMVSKSWNYGGSASEVPTIHGIGDLIQFLPYGMFTALFRPLPGEVMNPFGLMAGLENVVILFLLWRTIRSWTRKNWKDNFVIWFGVYVLLWSVIYAFLSPQNLGSAVRFRLQVLPVLLFLLFYLGILKPNIKPNRALKNRLN